MRVVNVSTAREVVLTGLRKYVWYEVQVLAYTRIGDGVLSTPPVQVRTFEDGKTVLMSKYPFTAFASCAEECLPSAKVLVQMAIDFWVVGSKPHKCEGCFIYHFADHLARLVQKFLCKITMFLTLYL